MAITIPTNAETTRYSYQTGQTTGVTFAANAIPSTNIAEGDHFVVFTGHSDDAGGSQSAPSGWTHWFEYINADGDDFTLHGYYHTVTSGEASGGSASAAFTFGENEEFTALMFHVEGADDTDFDDQVTPVATNTQNTDSPIPAAITTNTDGAVVIVLDANPSDAGHLRASSDRPGYFQPIGPAGYTIEDAGYTSGGNSEGAPGRLEMGTGFADAQMSWGWKLVASAGTETPGNWSQSGGNGSEFANLRDHKDVTMVIKPSSGAATLDMTPGLAQQLVSTFAPTVTTGAVDVTPGLAQSLVVAFDPVLTVGAVGMTPGLAQQLTVVFDPTVTTGAVDITPGLAQQLTVAFDPTLTTTIDVTPGLVQQLAVAFDPVLTVGAVDITPGLAQQLAVAHDPVVIAAASTQDVTPGLAQQLTVAFDPTVTVGAVGMTPGLAQSLIVAFDPTVTTGAANVTPGLAQQLVVAFDPTVDLSLSIIEPGLAQQLAVAYDPTVTTSAANVTPGLAQQLVVAFDPVLTTTVTVTPGVAQSLTVAIAATVTGPMPAIAPTVAQSLTVAVAVTVTTGPVTITPAVAQQLTVAVAVTITPGRIPGMYDLAAFYRNSNDRFVLVVGLSRTAAVGYKPSEGWYPASGSFALSVAPGEETACMTVGRAAWTVDKTSSNTVMYARVNTALATAGYRRPNGGAIE